MSARAQDEREAKPVWWPLPETLPEGERILWQGRPEALELARRAYGARFVALYFGLVGLFRVATTWRDGGSLGAIAESVAWSALPAVLALALLGLLAVLQSRVTCYTLTNRRIAMQIGVALPATVNIPLSKVLAVDRRMLPSGSCDLVLTVDGAVPLGAALLWPHVRLGGRGVGNQPVLRCLPDPERISALLAGVLAGEEPDQTVEKQALAAVVPIRRRAKKDPELAAALAGQA